MIRDTELLTEFLYPASWGSAQLTPALYLCSPSKPPLQDILSDFLERVDFVP